MMAGLIVSVIVTFAGCTILLFDVIVTKQTDYCQVKVPATYISRESDQNKSKHFSWFVLSIPEFEYEFEGRKYRGKSSNVFFHVLVPKNGLRVPFLPGKMYYVYVNPSQPSMYVTDGEQRIAFLHVIGCAVAFVGIGLLLWSTGFLG